MINALYDDSWLAEGQALSSRRHADNLINEATGGNAGSMEEFAYCEDVTRDLVVDILKEASVPFSEAVRFDLDQIFDKDEEPRYFIPHHRVVELYRERHFRDVNFAILEEDRTSVDNLQRQLREEQSQRAAYGVSLAMYRRGAACPAEQSFFYGTSEWQDRARAVKTMDRFTCRSCGRSGHDHEVHHDEHIYSVFSRHFQHNFDVLRLRCLCESCHDRFHRSHVRGYSHFIFANAGEVDSRTKSQRRRALKLLHDSAKECRFCFPQDRNRTGESRSE